MSKPRLHKQKFDNFSTAESVTTSVVHDGTDTESMPFLEWSDQDINMEKWEMPGKTSTTGANAFEDPQEVHLPPSLGAYEWKRCSEIFSDVTFSIFVNRPTYPDLVTPNQHLLKSEFYRSFISSIETLLYLGSSKSFPEEYGSPVYYAPTDRPWRPWYHIYSNCKVAKGHSEHSPLYNPYGKYVVRLYWMGCWRKIYVDDFIPIDAAYFVLLPSVYIPKVASQKEITEEKPEKRDKHSKDKKGGGHAKKEIVELWPMLLCKALLKIGALSWSTRHELIDFDIINCLTGWVPQRIKTIDISASDLWDIFMAYGERFQWEEAGEEGTKKSGSSKAKAKKKEKAEVGKKGTKASKMAIPSGIENMKEGDRYIVASCDNFEFHTGIEKVFQNKNYFVLINQVRDIPVEKPPPRPELELWKKFRYEEWAVNHGIIPPDIPKLNIKSLKIVDPFRRILNMQQEVQEVENKTHVTQESEITEKKSEKSSNSSKRAAAKVTKNRLHPDPTMWIDFDNLKKYVNHIHIYFQPRGFKSKAKISDINFVNKTTDFKHIVSPIDVKTRNEPIYLFMDSIDYKFLVINFTQIGNLAQLEKHVELPDVELLDHPVTQDHDLCVEIVLKKTDEKQYRAISVSQISNKSTLMCSFNTKPVNFVLEEYRWYTNVAGKARGMIRTYGNKSIILDLEPGRTSFRLWMTSHCSYTLQVFADTPMTIGNHEEYILASTVESQLLTNLCFDLSSCFGKLVQSFGMPEYSISLRNFYHCYKPFQNLTKSELITVHAALFDEFCKTIISNNLSPNTLECVRLLFLQLKTFNYVNPHHETPHICPMEYFSRPVQIDYLKEMQRAAVKLQAFFKGIYIRQLMKKHNEGHKQYYGIFEILKKVYIDIFSSERRLNFCPNLFRRLFERKDMEKLKEKFETYEEMKSVLQTHVFTDSVFVHEYGWITICRYEFQVNSPDPIIIKISLFCNLKTFYVRVFDNDTLKEIKRYTNNVSVEKYESNMYGYTILCYAWAEESTRLNWKLALANKKMSRTDLVIIPSYPIDTISLRDNYMPNFDNVICNYKIKVNMDMILTAHLRTSYDQVNVSLRLKDTDGKILAETSGCGSALLPLLYLHGISTGDERLIRSSKVSTTRHSAVSRYSDITYSRLNKYGESLDETSSRGGSQRENSDDFEVNQELEGKSTKRRNTTDDPDNDGDNISIRHGERLREGKIATKRGKVRHSDLSDSDSMSDKNGKRGSRSSEKLNKGSVSQGKNKNSIGSRPGTLTKLTETTQKEYVLEGIVLKNSWPLTAEEWEKTRILREKSYLNLLGERKSSASKKNNLMSKRVENPYWILNLVHAADDSLEYEQDRSKSTKWKDLKHRWFEDVDRYRKGIELREKYLQEYMVSNSNAIVDRLGIIRTNNPHDFAINVVKQPSIEQFMTVPAETVDEDSCKIKRSDTYCIDESTFERTLRQYSIDKQAIDDDTEEMLLDQRKQFEMLAEWFSEVRNDSSEMLADAVKLQKDYVKKLTESTSKLKGDKKGKQKKKK